MSSRWYRFSLAGCLHGEFQSEDAVAQFHAFNQRWEPHHVLLNGDLFDATMFRAGAKGTSDYACDPGVGYEKAKEFAGDAFSGPRVIRKDWILGNHEDRIWRLADGPDGPIKVCAKHGIKEVNEFCREHRARLTPYSMDDGVTIGDCFVQHGVMFNEMAMRDHAEYHGKCIIAHLHRCGQERGRRRGGATCYCCGCLCDIPNMDYAKRRKATSKWENGWIFGEYRKGLCVVHGVVTRQATGEWRMPV